MVTVVDKGIEIISKLINGVGSTPFTYMATGSGSTAEGTTQTALVTELTANGFARIAATCTNEGNTTAVWNKIFTCTTANTAVREVGIFDTATSGGNMCMRHCYASDKNIEVGQQLEITMKLEIGRAS